MALRFCQLADHAFMILECRIVIDWLIASMAQEIISELENIYCPLTIPIHEQSLWAAEMANMQK